VNVSYSYFYDPLKRKASEAFKVMYREINANKISCAGTVLRRDLAAILSVKEFNERIYPFSTVRLDFAKKK
jgi:hypothetical protein